ncbi:uncharacterized protein LOC127812305 [Diospyros lotus]|uniref:uncharacterized protein LOC127812305 n=1 Tax=Diospyros lotus TaxID=55363 RepID=UPI00225744DB|nr:uncharacterized protein LOC127812305 [Diospyros lotus]
MNLHKAIPQPYPRCLLLLLRLCPTMAFLLAIKALPILALALALCVHPTFGEGTECENLNKNSCSFAVSSSGKRCVLEKTVRRTGEEGYICRSSEIEADKIKDWIETDHCVESCGLDRTALGISSDSLLESQFAQKLCSSQCYNGCPNVVNLYFNLAAGEGVFLPKFCEAQAKIARRGMAEVIRSSGFVAEGPESGSVHAVKFTDAPAMAPY